MDSIWTKTAENRPRFEQMSGDIKTDVLIIGGGMAGILCAHRLKELGLACVLVEADRICGGITKNTTAKITLQHGAIYDKMIKRFGESYAKLYIEAQKEAMKRYEHLCEHISCGYEKQDSYVYSVDNFRKIEREAVALDRIGCKADIIVNDSAPLSIVGAVRVRGQAQFNPLEFAFEIAKELPIYEDTKVLEFRPDGIVTNRGRVFAEKIIVATHFPILNKHGSYFLKLYQHRSYVIALKNAEEVDGMYVDEDEKGMSFRNYGDVLLLGGGSHRTGKHGGNWRELEDFAKINYPKAEIVARWATQDCMTLDHIPYIGQYSEGTPNLYVATGFNKWGMTSAMVASIVLGDMIKGKSNDYAHVFSPQRSIFRPQLAINTFEALIGLVTPTVPRCPHMGCALRYNRQEHSWDCPCHGSRFTEDGKLIDNPATADKN